MEITMNTRFLLCVAAVFALGAAPLAVQAQGCKSNCSIDVVVSATATSCQITAPGKDDEFRIAPLTTTDITWKLKGAQGYEFTASGIKFKGPPPAGTFVQKAAGSKQEFIFTDVNDGKPGKKGTHKYAIEVQKGAIKCDLDPSIVNE
jgi:hypothetical protein